MRLLFRELREHEKGIVQRLGRPKQHLRILEIGPGQGRERARYFGINNEVVAMDLDAMARGFDPLGYLRMIRDNGFGRFLKTIGRMIIVGRKNRDAWARAVGTAGMREPHFVRGDICTLAPAREAFDVLMSWSVMEHLTDPHNALRHMVHALRPGGVLFISLHLYTCNSGHHDIRAFTGQEEVLPLWGHLRSSTQHLVTPSAYLNRWRLS
jgi:SAM-dependent methyltransferase